MDRDDSSGQSGLDSELDGSGNFWNESPSSESELGEF